MSTGVQRAGPGGRARYTRAVRATTRWLLLSTLVGRVVLAGGNPHLARAEADLKAVEYGAAVRSLEAALKEPGNDRQTMERIFELQGVAFATLNQGPKAVQAFRALLSLAPDFRLQGNYPPRVTTAFYEARGWAEQNGRLDAKAGEPGASGAQLTAVRVEVSNDPARLVKEVRFHVVAGGAPGDRDVPLAGKVVEAPVSGGMVTWWAELLGARKAVLGTVGTAAAPRVDKAPGAAAPAPVAFAPVEVKPDVAGPPPERPEVTAAGAPISGTRIAAWSCAGAAVAAAGVAVVFGLGANATAARVNGAERDGAGRIVGLTQKEAFALDAQQRTQSTLANVLIGTSAALAAGGVTLFLVSRGDSEIALVPTAGGAALVGTFP